MNKISMFFFVFVLLSACGVEKDSNSVDGGEEDGQKQRVETEIKEESEDTKEKNSDEEINGSVTERSEGDRILLDLSTDTKFESGQLWVKDLEDTEIINESKKSLRFNEIETGDKVRVVLKNMGCEESQPQTCFAKKVIVN